MPSLVIATANAIVAHEQVEPETALEQAQTASAGYPEATDVWLFDAASKAPWHASLVPAPRNKKRAA